MHVHVFISMHHTHFFRQQVDVLFVAAFRSIVQLYQSQRLGKKEQEIITMTTARLWHTRTCTLSAWGSYSHTAHRLRNQFSDWTMKSNSPCMHTKAHYPFNKVICVHFSLFHSCLTWVVAVMDSTKVGTVEQLRFRRRPCKYIQYMDWLRH